MRAVIRPFHAGIALLAGALIACELFLLRLFRLAHGGEFTEIAIGVALLGFGASGTLLAAGRGPIRRHARSLASACAALTGVTILLACQMAQSFTPRPGFLVWGGAEVWRLIAVTLPLCAPFLIGAAALGSVFVRWPRQSRPMYAFNLLGSGAGAIAAYLLLLVVPPERALALVAACASAAGGLLAWRACRKTAWCLPAACALTAAVLAVVPQRPVRLSDYKPLEIMLRFPGSRVLQTRQHPAGRVDVVESPAFHHAPGQSLLSPPSESRQVGVFVDGNLAGACYAGTTTPDKSVAPWMMPEALAGVASAVFGDFSDGTELARLLLLLPDGKVTLAQPHAALREVLRGLVPAAPGRIEWSAAPVMPLLQAMSAQPGAGDGVLFVTVRDTGSPLSEDLLLTRDGMRTLLRAVETAVLAVPMDHPPRASLRLLALCCVAARDHFGDAAGHHIVALRGHTQLAVVISRNPLSAPRAFAEMWGFDLCWASDMKPSEANRYNLLDAPVFYDTAHAILSSLGKAKQGAYEFDISPATAWRPFQWQPFHPLTLWAIVAGHRPAGLEAVPEANALLALVVKMQVLAVAALTLLFLPLGAWTLWARLQTTRRDSIAYMASQPAPTLGMASAMYFAALGLGYLSVEMLALFLVRRVIGMPILAAAVTVGGFLMASGLGSRMVRPGRLVFPLIIVLVLLMAGGMELLYRHGGALPAGLRVMLCLVCVMPPAFLMGVPFPAGLGALGRRAGSLVPWAWGLNGFASVLAAPLAVLLALTFGYGAVAVTGIICYILAAVAGRHLLPAPAVSRTPRCPNASPRRM